MIAKVIKKLVKSLLLIYCRWRRWNGWSRHARRHGWILAFSFLIKKNKPKQEDKLNHEYKKDKSIVQEKSSEIVDKNQQSADQDKNNKKPRSLGLQENSRSYANNKGFTKLTLSIL